MGKCSMCASVYDVYDDIAIFALTATAISHSMLPLMVHGNIINYMIHCWFIFSFVERNEEKHVQLHWLSFIIFVYACVEYHT